MRHGASAAITPGPSVPTEIPLPPTAMLIECGHTDRPGPPQPRGGSASRTHASVTIHLGDEVLGHPRSQYGHAVLLHLTPVRPEGVGEVIKNLVQPTRF